MLRPRHGRTHRAVTRLIQHELDEMDSAASLVFRRWRRASTADATATVGASGRHLHRSADAPCSEHPDLVQQYFMTEAVKPDHNKFTALHAALWDTRRIYLRAGQRHVSILPLQVILNQAQRRRGRLSPHAAGHRDRRRSHRGG